MAAITAALIKQVREETGAGMMDVKKALTEAEGDVARAKEIIRAKGIQAAGKREGRKAQEGTIASKVVESADGQTGYAVELNSETDFVAKTPKFVEFADSVLEDAVKAEASSVDEVLAAASGDATVKEAVEEAAALFGEHVKVGIDTTVIRRIAGEIVPAVQQGVQVAIVVGGGNFFRGAELQQAGIDRSRGDYMGMLGTVMNCLALQDFLEQEGQATRVQTAITMGQVAEPYIPLKAIRHLEKGRVVIFGAGAGMPYFSTDTVSIQRSLEIHCDEVLMGKNGVDGVYTADPRKDENARRFATLSYNRALVDNLAVMDASALSMARDNKQLIRVFGLEGEGNVTRALLGEEIGTMVSTAESSLAE